MLIVTAVIALAAAGYLAATHTFNPNADSGNGNTVSLYFLDNTKTTLVKEQRKMQFTPGEAGLAELVNMLIAGPKNSVDLKRAIPEKTQLLSLTLKEDIATVDFSKDYYSASNADNMLAAFTVVNTLCDAAGVSKVVILVNGQELIGTNKKPLGALGKDDIVYEGSKTQTDSVELSLYFPAADGEHLQPEKRTVTLKDKEPLAKLAVIELMKGSENKQLQKPIPAETKLLSVETKENICFVNFSKEFIEKYTAGSSAEIMTVYSIVDSLTEISGIERVQFLIEGKKVESFGSLVFDEPLERSALLIKDNSEATGLPPQATP